MNTVHLSSYLCQYALLIKVYPSDNIDTDEISSDLTPRVKSGTMHCRQRGVEILGHKEHSTLTLSMDIKRFLEGPLPHSLFNLKHLSII